jgi:hypothetical protein
MPHAGKTKVHAAAGLGRSGWSRSPKSRA